MGCGKNGSFDIHPDWRQWAVLLIKNDSDSSLPTPLFIQHYWQFFYCEKITFMLEPIEGHGTWDNKNCFGELAKQTDHDGTIAVLTRATIRLNKLNNFWKNVPAVSHKINGAEGLLFSAGIGEMPFIRQATFSIWKNKDCMKQFAYKMKEHQHVIHKTRTENWYKEEMFVRFKVIECYGSINGKLLKT